jgi:hypothetical protein
MFLVAFRETIKNAFAGISRCLKQIFSFKKPSHIGFPFINRLAVIFFLPILCTISTFAGESTNTYVLADFNRAGALDKWYLKHTAAETLQKSKTDSAMIAHIRFPRWRPGRGKWPAAILNFRNGGFTICDWQPYQSLAFEVFNHNAAPAELKLRLDDVDGQQAIRVFSLPGERTTQCEVTLAALGDEIDVANIVHFNLYMTQPAADYTLALGEIRLQAEALDLEKMQFRRDPFSGGRVQVHARFNRRAWIEVMVLDTAGKEVTRHQVFSDRLVWQQQANLSSGTYQVELWGFDLDWHGPGLQRTLGSFEVVAENERREVAAWSEPTTRKVMLHSRPQTDQAVAFWDTAVVENQGMPLRIEMAQNEYEGVQAVFLNRATDAIFLFAIEDLKHGVSDKAFPLQQSAVYQVGYVRTEAPGIYPVDFIGWWPDPLLVADSLQATAGECMPVWIHLKSTRSTEPGPYRGRLGVWRDGTRLGSLPLEVQVYNATLPDTTTVRTAFSFYSDMLERIYDPDTAAGMYGQYSDFISDHRLNLTHLYRRTPPAIKEVTDLLDQGRLNAFNLLYLPPDDYSADQLERLAEKIEPLVEELRRRGLMRRAYIYAFDEANPERFEALRRAFGFFKERFPDIQTMATARDPSFGLESSLDAVVDIWVPLPPAYNLASAQAARRRGREVWWYICVSPQHPYANWFVEYPALEARLLWWMSYQQRVPGFLYYSANRWPNQNEPLRLLDGNRTNWNPASYKTANGDGCLFYGGPEGPVTTIRLENVRDGIEDYELLHLLSERLADQGAASRQFCNELIASLTEFSNDPDRFAAVRSRLLKALAQTTDHVPGLDRVD